MDKRKRRLLCMLEGSGRKSRWISGVPPLSFKALTAGALENYRIYGNTVDGESVGDRTGNLFDENSLISPISGFTWYFDDEHYLLATNTSSDIRAWSYSQSQFFIALSAGTYTLRLSGVGATSQYSLIRVFESNDNIICTENIAGKTNIVITFTLNTPKTIGIEIKLYDGKYRFMLNSGSTALPYEPYGYKVAVTVSNGTDTLTTPIYLPEQMRKFGDYSDYADYEKQKVIKRVGHTVFTSVSGWVQEMQHNFYYDIPVSSIKQQLIRTNKVKSVYTGVQQDADENNCFISWTGKINVWLPEIDSLSEFQDWLNEEPFIVDYGIENTDLDVTLPALPTSTGTNVLSVGTAVQPSEVYIKGKIKEVN